MFTGEVRHQPMFTGAPFCAGGPAPFWHGHHVETWSSGRDRRLWHTRIPNGAKPEWSWHGAARRPSNRGLSADV